MVNMDKQKILTLIIAQLSADLDVCEQAVSIARDTAVHADCLGSSKYETMGLEASYLAQGQGKRLLEVERALAYFEQLSLPAPSPVIGLSSLVVLADEHHEQRYLWLAADAGGLKIDYADTPITIITVKSPLGSALVGKASGDEFEICIAGKTRAYTVVSTC